MKCNRANFALHVIDNQVYVFGGIEGSSNHIPQLSSLLCEKYDPKTDKGEPVTIEGPMSLAAFGWTTLKDPNQIFVIGGTDGDMLQESGWTIDFK